MLLVWEQQSGSVICDSVNPQVTGEVLSACYLEAELSLKGWEVDRCSMPAKESSENSLRSEGSQGWWREKGLF